MGGGIGPQESPTTDFWMCPGMPCDHSDDATHTHTRPRLGAAIPHSFFEHSPV